MTERPPEDVAYKIDRARLPMWVIYDHPKDFPNNFVARLWYTLPGIEPTSLTMLAKALHELQQFMESAGCTKVSRDPKDDPVIIESWIV